MKEYKRYTIKEGATLPMSQWGGSPAELELYRKLAELEDKIENGTLIELPCKVGQPIWIICYELWTTKPIVDESFIKSFEQIAMIMEREEIGKTVFHTKAEAEAKLKELREKEECR